jgi:hypothetical protein
MTLSPELIQVLFDFTKKKYVHFYDLQSEIADHLAAAIEDRISENRKLSFEQALEEVYSGFGIFGFAHVVREKEKQIDKQAKRMLWKETVLLFTWPHLLFSFLVLVSLYTFTQLFSMKIVLITTLVLSLFLWTIYLWRVFKSPKPGKALMMLNYYQPGFAIAPYFYSQFYLNFNTVSSGFFISFTFFSIIYLVASYRVNAKIKSNAMALYPEAFAPKVSD